MTTFLALLRGINVGGKNKIAMQELRELCDRLGWQDVRTYIQSGNIVFRAEAGTAGSEFDTAGSGSVAAGSAHGPERLEGALEEAIEQSFGLAIPVLVRSSQQWRQYERSNPFPEESDREPNLVMIALAKSVPGEGAVERLRERAAAGERVERVGDALWVYFPEGSGRSRITPTFLDRAAGSAVTTRNWRTVQKLGGIAAQLDGTE